MDLKINRTLYCFWFGPEMSHDRRQCFNSILLNSMIEVKLITEKNLLEYNISSSPIHQDWQHLSSTHKSDYLRSYFMYHYGGGYSDVKLCNYNWNIYFDILEQNNDKDFIGYPELSPTDIAYVPYQHLYKELIGNGSYIFKKSTEFAKEWLDETNKKMDEISEKLRLYPGDYHPRAVKGGINDESGFENSKYPLEWNELLGRIFHKLLPNYKNSFIIRMPRINVSNYR
jgi:hypothetical protein